MAGSAIPPRTRPWFGGDGHWFGSLRVQLLAPIAGVIVLSMLVQSSQEERLSRRRIEEQSAVEARATLLNARATIERLLQIRDRAGAEAAVTRLGSLPNLEMAALIDRNARIVTSTRYELRGRPVGSTPLGPALAAFDRAPRGLVGLIGSRGSERMIGAAPVFGAADGAPLRLVTAYDLEPQLEAQRRAAFLQGLLAMLARFGVLAFVWLMVELRVARPASRIASVARRFGEGDFTVRTGLKGPGELESTGEAFDRMATQIESDALELRRTRNMVDGLLRSLPVGVIAVERKTLGLLFANPQWLEFYGQTFRPDMDYPSLCESVRLEHDDGRPYAMHELTVPSVLHTGRPVQVDDLVLNRQDGVRVPLVVSAVPVNIGGGPEFDTVVCVAQDRRELERAFGALRDWERRFETIVEATGQVVYEWDFATDRVQRSGSVQSVLGIPERDISGGITQWKSRLHPEEYERVMREIDTAIRERRTFASEYRFRRGDGRWIVIRDRGFLQLDAEDVAVRMLGTMDDVTEQRSLEQQLRHAQKMETVGTLAGGIAHDFNNQLTGVMGSLDLLGAELPGDDPRQEHVKLAYRAAQRCAELTSGLLAFSRRLTSHPRPTCLNTSVIETAALLKRMLPAPVRLSTRLEPEPWTALADPGQIQQVLMNLCVNARDAMPQGGDLILGTRNVLVEPIGPRRHPDAVPGEFVEVWVSDTGTGISADTLPRIFEPFFTTKSVGTGTGLGLSMVYGIVSAHHGWIETESVAGEGTTFRVFLPRALGAPSDLGAERRQATLGGRETVLVVDDEPAVRDLAMRNLAAAGYQVLCAREGDEALSIYRARAPLGQGTGAVEVVLLDLTMPGRSGRAVLAELLAIEPGARVILSSGYSSEMPAAGAAGEADFLAKPYSMHQLLACVRRVLDHPAPGSASTARTVNDAGESFSTRS